MEPILPEPTPLEPASQSYQPSVPSSGMTNDASQQLQSVQPIQQAPQAVQPIAVQPIPQQQVAPVQQSDVPLIADDVDVIEKEWVDKAKNIVNKTKEDPFEQEKEVSKLQVDYLAKRYNKNIKQAQ